jgi:transitional endoplasmic reticulum ATPase
VLAAQTDATFHAINAADVFSKWMGESEKHVKELFEAARENPPAIIFIDEIEAMDGMERNARVFVLGATNRPDLLDAAVLRSGRLGETIEIGLPDADGRLALLRLHARRMRLAPDVDLAALAAEAEGASGADLKGLCTAAGRNALLRELEAGGKEPAVTTADFRAALGEIFPNRWRAGQRRPVGFQGSAS